MSIEKTIEIVGMSCNHCVARVEKALDSIDGVESKVNLKKGTATVKLSKEVSDVSLKQAVEDAGYEVMSIRPV